METMFAALMGLGLSAACGFRVFVPLLALSLAANGGYIELGSTYDWVATDRATVILAIATFLEIGAYYIPWLDNLLDTVAAPAAVIAGAITSMSVLGNADPFLTWTFGAIAGGGTAGTVHLGTTVTRQASLLTTGGIGNPVVSTGELGGAVTMSITAIVMPFIAGIFVIALFYLTYRALRWASAKRKQKQVAENGMAASSA